MSSGPVRGFGGKFKSAKQKAKRELDRELALKLNAKRCTDKETLCNQPDIEVNSRIILHSQENGNTQSENEGPVRGFGGKFKSAKQSAKRELNRQLAQQLNAKRCTSEEMCCDQPDIEVNSRITLHSQENGNTQSENQVSLPSTPTIPCSPYAYAFMTGSVTPEIFRASIHYSPNVPTTKVRVVLHELQQCATHLQECNPTRVHMQSQTIINNNKENVCVGPKKTNYISHAPPTKPLELTTEPSQVGTQLLESNATDVDTQDSDASGPVCGPEERRKVDLRFR